MTYSESGYVVGVLGFLNHSLEDCPSNLVLFDDLRIEINMFSSEMGTFLTLVRSVDFLLGEPLTFFIVTL